MLTKSPLCGFFVVNFCLVFVTKGHKSGLPDDLRVEGQAEIELLPGSLTAVLIVCARICVSQGTPKLILCTGREGLRPASQGPGNGEITGRFKVPVVQCTHDL
jgi:hypothetical protein